MAETLHRPPYRTVLKPYGRALVELARRRPEVVCLSGDLTRQCEVDLFQAEFGDRFIHAGMAEANMIGVAGALARQGFMPFVHSSGGWIRSSTPWPTQGCRYGSSASCPAFPARAGPAIRRSKMSP